MAKVFINIGGSETQGKKKKKQVLPRRTLNCFCSHIPGFPEICRIRIVAFNSSRNWVVT